MKSVLDNMFPFVQYSPDRWADCFVRPVDAADPTTGPSHAVFQLTYNPSNVIFSGLFFFGVLHPANPLVTGKRREAFPKCKSLSIMG